MRAIRDALITMAALVIGAFMIQNELDKRANTALMYKEVREFMGQGKRFPLQYGLGLCERIYRLETLHNLTDKIDCDAIRHSVESRQTTQSDN